MERQEGFIILDKILQEIGADITDFDSILASPLINKIKKNHTGTTFSFDYKGETYFYKYSSYKESGHSIFINPYSELVAEELASDFGIPCASYDLAILKNCKGVLSKDFRKSGMNYFLWDSIFNEKKINYYVSNSENDLVKKHRSPRNVLDDIWDLLEMRYPNQRETISYLMKKIVDIYIFDIITDQLDRHEENLQIMECLDAVDIAPIYDNERILLGTGIMDIVNLGVEFGRGFSENIFTSIKRFQAASGDEFSSIIYDKMWIIGEENLYSVFERIEKKTGYPMPEESKQYYLDEYRKHYEKLLNILGCKERDDHNERKNR